MQRGPLMASLPTRHMAPGGTTVADTMYNLKSTLWSSTMKDCCSQVIQSLNSVELLNYVQFFVISRTVARQVSLSITNSQSLLRLMSIESLKPFNHLILCRPLLLPPSIFPSIRVFPMSQFFTSGGQSIGVSASASVLPMNIQDWFPLGCTGWISLQSRGLSRVFYTTVQKHQFFALSLLYTPTLTSIHDYWKNHCFDKTNLCWQNNVSAF